VISTRTADEWERAFDGQDVCVSVVKSLQDAAGEAMARDPESFRRTVHAGAQSMPALPLPLAEALRRVAERRRLPGTG
jgi:crotonobetainyl-CoA:carnitine CoA-transferase CaiB-like acyl-CoA transferase